MQVFCAALPLTALPLSPSLAAFMTLIITRTRFAIAIAMLIFPLAKEEPVLRVCGNARSGHVPRTCVQ